MNHGKCLLELEEKDVRNIFDVNILSHFWLCKEFLEGMLKNGGHIVNVSSACGQMGSYKLTDYCSTKFAVVGFTESLRIEIKTKYPNANVKCSIVCPFLVRTKLFNGVEFRRLKWLNLNMDVDYVGEKIFQGILMQKELIYIPSMASHMFFAMRQLVTTKFLDYSCKKLELSNSMDAYKKKSI
jgi:all-trans-retinol dehydrogenase (NAD+)